MKAEWLLIFTLLLTLAFAAGLACGDDDDDNDDNDDDTSEDYPATISGTLYYNGDLNQEGSEILIALTDEWPMTGAPLYYTTLEIPASGFPFAYSAPLDRTGEFYLLAAIDVDPHDVMGMNTDTDPLAIPESTTTVQAGDNPGVDFTFVNPDELPTDDDDDDNNDNNDAADDDDTGPETGLQGSITYAGAATGDNVYLSFFSKYLPGLNVPTGAPDFTFPIAANGKSFELTYLIDLAELTIGEKYLIYCHLDVDGDPEYDSDTDPVDKASPMMIEQGKVKTHDFTLVDP